MISLFSVRFLEIYMSPQEHPQVQLVYPSGDCERFILIHPDDEHEHDPIEDLVGSIKLVATEFKSQFAVDFVDKLERAKTRDNVNELVELTATFNEKIRELRARGEFEGEPLGSSFALASHIWKQAYERTLEDPKLLNQYKGFSKEVYGETNPILINDIITKQLNLKPGDIFVDLGSGIGNVVFQVAAQTRCKCHGIELKDNPSQYAQLIQREAERRCRFYHKDVGEIRLRQGDFLNDAPTPKLVAQADVVFVNNFVFDAETNLGLMYYFLDMKEGAKVICFKEFSPPSNRISGHNQNNVAAILQTRKVDFWGNDGVSWTASNIAYFIHVIDRKRLNDFEKRATMLPEPRRRGKRADTPNPPSPPNKKQKS